MENYLMKMLLLPLRVIFRLKQNYRLLILKTQKKVLSWKLQIGQTEDLKGKELTYLGKPLVYWLLFHKVLYRVK